MTTTENRPRVWFITGASSGIGFALGQAAIARGDNVVAIARNPATLKEVVDRHPDQMLAIAADIRSAEQIKTAVRQGLDKFGHLDVVANNAGYGVGGAVEEVTVDELRAAFETNFFGAHNVIRAVLPTLRAQRSGHILQVAAYRGQNSSPGFGVISAFNYAKEGLADALYYELKPLGIHVTIVEPGPSLTNFVNNVQTAPTQITDYDQTVRAARQIIDETPESHFDLPEPIATAIMAAVDAEEPPLRLATGSVAVNSIRRSLKARLANLEAWESVSVAVDHDPARSCPLDAFASRL